MRTHPTPLRESARSILAEASAEHARSSRAIERAPWGRTGWEAACERHGIGHTLRRPPFHWWAVEFAPFRARRENDPRSTQVEATIRVPVGAVVWAGRELARAVEHMARQRGARVDLTRLDPRRGGWDSADHWGLGLRRLAMCWREARCRTGARFVALLRWCLWHPGEAPPRVRGLSLDGMLALLASPVCVRGPVLERDGLHPERDGGECHSLDRRARIALGRLGDPVLRAAALRGAVERAYAGVEGVPLRRLSVRVRHLDFVAVARAQRTLAAIRDGEQWRSVRAAYLQCAGLERAALRVAGGPLQHPTWPQIARSEIVAALLIGEGRAEIAPELTQREFAAWLADGAGTLPTPWLARHFGVSESARTVGAVRWLDAVMRDPARRSALERERTLRGAHGEVGTVRFIDRADEIIDADLPSGTRTGVDTAFERAAERVGQEALLWAREDQRILAPVPAWWRPVRCARLLRTTAELVAEGDALRHCVGSYAHYVAEGASTIVALCVRGNRSTVELDRLGTVRQHHGPGNGEPHALCGRALRVCLQRWGLPALSKN